MREEIPSKLAKILYKCLVNYYLHLKIVDSTWNDMCKSAKEIIKGLKNRCQQLRLVTRMEADKVEIYKIEGLREKLILKIFRGIQEEIALLGNLSTRLNSINQELKNKLMRLEEARSNVSLMDIEMQDMVNGTPVVPRLKKLLMWAIDACEYYQTLHRSITESMVSLDYKTEETINRLEISFHMSYFWRQKINRVCGFTENLSKTNVSLL